MLGFRRGLDPGAVLFVEDLDRFARNHLACSAFRTIDGAHCPSAGGFGDEFDFETRTTTRTGTREYDITLQTILPNQ